MAAPSFWRLFAWFFLATVVPYGVGMVAFCLILSGNLKLGLLLGGGGALVFACLVATILAGLNRRALQGLPFKSDDNPLSVHQRRTVELKVSPSEAFELCTSSLKCLGRAEVTVSDQKKGLLEAVTATSGRGGFGQSVSFEVCQVGENHTRVTVHSRLRRKIHLVDYGNNLENVLKLVNFLEKSGRSI